MSNTYMQAGGSQQQAWHLHKQGTLLPAETVSSA
jgi:hypothetical protein